MKRVLITGGAGFVGYHMASYLLGQGDYQITLFDNLQRGKKDGELVSLIDNNIELIQGDLTDVESIKTIPPVDYVYHFAAIVGVKNVIDQPYEVLRTNILSVLNIIEYARKSNTVDRLLFASTSEVYAGTLENFDMPIPTDETVPITLGDLHNPRTTYALSKAVGEVACINESESKNINCTIVRYHNVYGPRMGFSHVIPELMFKMLKEEKITISSPEHTRAFCYIDDAINATVSLAENSSTSGQLFNVGNPFEEIKIMTLAKKLKYVTGSTAILIPGKEVPGSPKRRVPDVHKAEKAIGYRPKIGLEMGLKMTHDWYLKAHLNLQDLTE